MNLPIPAELLIAMYATAPTWMQEKLEAHYGTDILDHLLREQV